MNHKFFISVLTLLCCIGVQQLEAQMFRGGMHAGLTASEVSGDEAGGPDKLGWFATVFTNRDISEFSRFQLEIMYIQKGSRVYYDPWDDIYGNGNSNFDLGIKNNDNNDPDLHKDYRNYRFNLHYVEIPIFFIFDFSSITGLTYVDRISGEFGLSVSTVVGHFETDDWGREDTDNWARRRPFKTAELNVIAGLQYPISEKLSFQIRFSQGVTPIREFENADAAVCTNFLACYRKRNQFNTVWSFGLSYTMFYGGD